MRDPLAVMASRKVMEERATGQFGVFRTALGQLADSYRIADAERAHANRERYLLIRFEELLEEPQRTTDRLASFLDVTNLPILHRPTSGGMFTASNSSFGAGESGTIDRSRARAAADVLLPDERLRVAVAVGDAAGALGYAVTRAIHYRSHRAKCTHRRRALRAQRSQPDRRGQRSVDDPSPVLSARMGR